MGGKFLRRGDLTSWDVSGYAGWMEQSDAFKTDTVKFDALMLIKVINNDWATLKKPQLGIFPDILVDGKPNLLVHAGKRLHPTPTETPASVTPTTTGGQTDQTTEEPAWLPYVILMGVVGTWWTFWWWV